MNRRMAYSILILPLWLWACGDSPNSAGRAGRIVLEVSYGEGSKATEVQAVDRMVATLAQRNTVVLEQDLQREGSQWKGEIVMEAGTYTVMVEAYKLAEVKWRGSTSVIVQPGKTNRAQIQIRSTEPLTVDLPGGASMEFVWIVLGTFRMGSPSSDPGRYSEEEPQHEVTISRGGYLGKYEITQGQWESVMGTTPWSGQNYVQANPDHPAVYISWDDVQEFIGRLNEAAGEELYRLPTEAEWEYACRAGTTTRWSFGDDEAQLEEYAWYYNNTWYAALQYAQPVGTKRPNPWGVYDMHGSVWEWCRDWWGAYASDCQVDPTGPATGSDRVIRGGSFASATRYVRSAYRYRLSPSDRRYLLGARLLRIR